MQYKFKFFSYSFFNLTFKSKEDEYTTSFKSDFCNALLISIYDKIQRQDGLDLYCTLLHFTKNPSAGSTQSEPNGG